MNDWLFGILVMLGFLILCVGVPFSLVFIIISSVAWARTKQWKKAKAKHAMEVADVEMDRLVSEDDEEDEPLDSEDEAEITARKQAEKEDWNLTTYQKWKKELRAQFSGAAQRELMKKKEQEDRAKIAREVAREMLRAQRRQERKDKRSKGSKAQEAAEEASAEQEHGLPTYDVATASSS